MDTPKEKQAPKKPEKKEDNNVNVELQKELQKRDTDTAPDEFISPNADTDEPIDGSVVNDAVLRGEPHADDTVIQKPDQKEEEKK
ncbi:MAG: hypothetical protein ACJ751_06115 [Niastella sp.]|uniref:hypothetical protein n=1 Tax=Niastella sp. TaxID=1869183 RepID=UPI00389983E3